MKSDGFQAISGCFLFIFFKYQVQQISEIHGNSKREIERPSCNWTQPRVGHPTEVQSRSISYGFVYFFRCKQWPYPIISYPLILQYWIQPLRLSFLFIQILFSKYDGQILNHWTILSLVNEFPTSLILKGTNNVNICQNIWCQSGRSSYIINIK